MSEHMSIDIAARGTNDTENNEVDPELLRSVMGRFCTGIAVITATDDRGPAGMLVQSLVSVSLDPPMVLFCPQKTSTSWPRIASTGAFGVNILSADQQGLCGAFATSGGDKFRDTPWYHAVSGAPVLADHLAYLDCRIHAVHEAGDHHIVLGSVEAVSTSEADEPLLFYRGRFGRWAA